LLTLKMTSFALCDRLQNAQPTLLTQHLQYETQFDYAILDQLQRAPARQYSRDAQLPAPRIM
jgi:hypothetical protein